MGERVYISCSAPYGVGGLGQRLAELVEQTRQRGDLAGYFCSLPKADDGCGVAVTSSAAVAFQKRLIRHFGPAWRSRFGAETFDRAVSRQLTQPIDALVGVAGQALQSFRRARALGARRLELVAPTAHVSYTFAKYREALLRHPIESSWLSRRLLANTRQEYEMADVIWTVSDYVAETFVDLGIPAGKIRKIPTSTDPRFAPSPQCGADNVFRIVYTGALTVTKGVPLLMEAYDQLPIRRKQLTLVGGWGTRGMRKYLHCRTQGRPDIRIRPGDPLPHLQQASAYVHPSWQDGYGRAAVEAMRCGVPVIVTDDTGMKELIRAGDTGFTVPTGDVSAIRRCLEQMAEHRSVAVAG